MESPYSKVQKGMNSQALSFVPWPCEIKSFTSLDVLFKFYLRPTVTHIVTSLHIYSIIFNGKE